jgi:tRNA-dihydrouridine synthase 1
MQAVREAVSVPVLANGNIRTLQDVHACLQYTGAAGVLSAESLLEDPALFSPQRLLPGGEKGAAEGARLLLEYLDLVDQYPAPMRMVTGHAFKMLGAAPHFTPRWRPSHRVFLMQCCDIEGS